MFVPKRIFKCAILASFLVGGTLFAQDLKTEIQEIKVIKAGGFQVKEVMDLGDVYAVKAFHPKAPKLTLFVSKNKEVIIMGNGFDKEGKKIDFKINMEQFKSEKAYSIGGSSGGTNNEYYLFTDPECPYCQNLEKTLPKLKQGTTLHVFFFPLDFHKNAIAMTKYILSQKTDTLKAEAMKGIADGKTDYKNAKYSDEENTKFTSIIQKHKQIASEIGVSGTPAVFSKDGESIQWPDLFVGGGK